MNTGKIKYISKSKKFAETKACRMYQSNNHICLGRLHNLFVVYDETKKGVKIDLIF